MTVQPVRPIPFPTSFYAAIVRSDGDETKLWIDGPKRRIELTLGQRLHSVTIGRQDIGVMYGINVDDSTYHEILLGPNENAALNSNLEDDVMWHLTGTAEIDGQIFDKYESWDTDRKSPFPRELVFIDADSKMRRRVVTINRLGNPVLTIDYRDVVLGPQPPDIFEPPENFRKTRL